MGQGGLLGVLGDKKNNSSFPISTPPLSPSPLGQDEFKISLKYIKKLLI
jgi:hypothetical protein